MADAGAAPWISSGYAERDGLWIAAAAWERGRSSVHERLSPPCPAGFGGSPVSGNLACHKLNTRSYRTDGSAMLSPQRCWHSGLRRVCQQHCPVDWSPQQPPIWRHVGLPFADVQHRRPQSQLGPVDAGL